MRKWVSILFLSIIVLSHSELHQLLRIPVLIDHFKEHKKEDPSITFIQFIKLHYDKIVVDDDYQRDQQLPFRDANCTTSVSGLVIDIPPQNIKIEKQDYRFDADKVIPIATVLYLHLCTSTIFQPPRVAA
ncbi:MAG: hypothetical protein IPH34_04555 [Chitinophagaceae bacterium]|nr:hypothetical protein [Chitinophagaceae bacterium]MBK8310719.1 hypothetical protein [Chitinophagaceae bacterium]MBK8607299.1 hypothetical protein [Chitinophagaceae bacterium]MBP6478558.1 hypothetical protein [Chitinophagaceae bacterium]MBP7108759.1 hypothetical protein [Chitinophagaceae bacterium]